MGQCTSKDTTEGGEMFNKKKRHESVFRSGVRFKGMEFSGIIGFASTTDNVYTPSVARTPPDDQSVVRSGAQQIVQHTQQSRTAAVTEGENQVFTLP